MVPETNNHGPKNYHRLVLAVKFVGDMLLLNAATITVLCLYENLFDLNYTWHNPLAVVFTNVYFGLGTYVKLSVIYSAICAAVFLNRGLYVRQRSTARLDELYLVMKSLILAAFLMMAVTILVPQLPYARAVVIGNFVVSLALIDLWRITVRKVVGYLAARGVGLVRVVIYGAGRTGRVLVNQMKHHPEFGYIITGFVDDDPAKRGRVFDGVPVLGAYDDLQHLLVEHDVNEVVVAIPSATHRHLLNVVFDLRERRIPFMVIADLYELVTRRVSVTQVGSIPLLRLWREPLDGWQGYLKRVLDIAAASFGIGVSFPLWVVIMVLIKLDSPGPVFFRQERVGKGGRRFKIFKFRSMCTGAEEMLSDLADYNDMEGPIFKIKQDPRVTRVGKWLRKFSLDELPQFINIFRGDMALIGPRPPLPNEVERYERWQMKRLAVPQGATGLWQVSGRNLLTFEEMVRLDIYYIENWSLWLDLKILLKTIPVVLLMRGAY